ncbi:MAG TPA: outer membrane beta-barrel protein [Bacteroidia bacterium]|nr:outer membrane beta-barrel protein [Bacteroidia bacterium]
MKNIKHFILAILLSVGFAKSIHAQIYVGAGAGYGLPAMNEMIGSNSVETETTDTEEGVYSSFGKGILPGLYVGYMFNENWGAELGFGMLMGQEVTITFSETNPTTNVTSNATETYKGKMMRITPGIRYYAGSDNLRPYLRMGFVIGVGGKLEYTYHKVTTNPSQTNTYDDAWEFSGAPAFGFSSGLGIQYMFSDKFGVFGEVGAIFQKWAPAKAMATKSMVDGQDQLPGMNVADKQIEFFDEYTSTSQQDPNQPSPEIRRYYPFSSWGINAGVHLKF